jgi:hypothetical protein
VALAADAAALSEIFVPGIEKIQFILHRSDYMQIDYMAPHNIDASLKTEFQDLLNLRGASRTNFPCPAGREYSE